MTDTIGNLNDRDYIDYLIRLQMRFEQRVTIRNGVTATWPVATDGDVLARCR